MKKIIIKTIGFLTITLLISSCAKKALDRTNPLDPQNPKKANISGKTYDSVTNVAISDVSVSIVSSDSKTVTTLSSSTGNYSYTDLAPGIYYLHATKIGYTDKNQTDVQLKSEADNIYDLSLDAVVPTTTTTTTTDTTSSNKILDSLLKGSYSEEVNYILSLNNSPYNVTDNVSFINYYEGRTTLTIEPGVIIKFAASYHFIVDCPVTANGTSSNPIKFTSGKSAPTANDYQEIKFGDSFNKTTTILNYIIFEYGSIQNIYGNSNSKMTNCTFTNYNSSYPTLFTNGEVKNCNFQKTGSSVFIAVGSPIISYCNITGEIETFLGAGQYKINYCNLTKGTGTILTNKASYTIDVTNNWWGTIDSSTIQNYIDSSYYGAGIVNYSPYASSLISTAGPQ
ncbi:MAG: carboxypeptidase-like regulatory domain-containing protein [Candidatus Firestonebacteria bacterium]